MREPGALGKIEKRGEHRKFGQKSARWCAQGVQDPGLCRGWGQSGLHGSIQGQDLAQDGST